jgi:hypothetical protein
VVEEGEASTLETPKRADLVVVVACTAALAQPVLPTKVTEVEMVPFTIPQVVVVVLEEQEAMEPVRA